MPQVNTTKGQTATRKNAVIRTGHSRAGPTGFV